MHIEVVLIREVAEAPKTEELAMFMLCYVEDYAVDVANPSVVLLPVEQIYLTRVVFAPTDIDRNSRSALIVIEREDIDLQGQQLFQLRNLLWLERVWNVVQMLSLEIPVVKACP